MTDPLRVLIVEDSEDDALLVLHELRKGGFAPSHARVDTPEAMAAALREGVWDIVLSDYLMPQFNGMEALRTLRESGSDLPFILLSGKIGEETAVEALKAGAGDFVMKGRLSRLCPAIRRELRETTTRRQKREAEARLLRLNRTLRLLSEGNSLLVHATVEDELLQALCNMLTDHGGYRLAWVGYAEQDPDRSVRPVAWTGGASEYIKGIRVTWADEPEGSEPTGTAIRTGRPAYFRDSVDDPQAGAFRERAARYGLRSCLGLPLHDGGRAFGALSLCSDRAEAFDEEEISLLEELANDLAYGIVALRTRTERDSALAGQAKSLQLLGQSLEETIQAIATAAEMRDPYTGGHQRRVANLAAAIAGEMGLPDEQQRGLRLAGVVHDIGKIQVPSEILSKPSRLTDIEFAMIKTHSGAGYDILKQIRFPWPLAEMVRQHHERLDGSGYPGGLKGDEILLEGRILGVADVVEAMASYRPYRPALGLDKALEHILANRGKLYEPQAVDACLAVFREGRFDLPG